MQGSTMSPTLRTDLRTPRRNRYHYGQLLGVEQFVLETDYSNGKRWLLNRLVSGYGVVCGLNVLPGPDRKEIVVTPGLAIDRWGREIIVPKQTDPVRIPEADIARGAEIRDQKQQSHRMEQETHAWVQVVLCYQECESDPVPVMAGDCNSCDTCASSTIREVYRIEFVPGAAACPACECRIPDVVNGTEIDHAALARWVTHNCQEVPDDPCIPLANVRITSPEEGHECQQGNIDITVRPIVYTNDLLFDLLVCVAGGAATERRWK